MLVKYPLFPFQTSNIDWTREWLFMTVLDYYGAALSLAAVAIFSEPPIFAILWTLGFCLLGSPICCAYVVYRIYSKSLVLRESEYDTIDK
eukprot:gene12418-26120_t